jgi:phosphatidylglycerol:prolipoprotein diacylglycerol transferase
MMALAFPAFDPVALDLGFFQIRWYALAYIAGLVIGWRLVRMLARRAPVAATAEQVDDFLTWATLGVIIGGRLGYVLFYRPLHYLQNPLEILQVWSGGMSFHGGALGVIVAAIIFCRRNNIDLLAFGDRIAVVTPIGLFLGRIANFINGELWGRPAPGVPWAMVFPTGGPVPRHPSQLYQAALEGLLLFAVLWALARSPAVLAARGTLVGVFLAGYGLARIVGETFRQPDAFMGFLISGTTMGQWLSVPMVLAGLAFLLHARRRAA